MNVWFWIFLNIFYIGFRCFLQENSSRTARTENISSYLWSLHISAPYTKSRGNFTKPYFLWWHLTQKYIFIFIYVYIHSAIIRGSVNNSINQRSVYFRGCNYKWASDWEFISIVPSFDRRYLWSDFDEIRTLPSCPSCPNLSRRVPTCPDLSQQASASAKGLQVQALG